MDITEKIIKLLKIPFAALYISMVMSPILLYLLAGDMTPSLPTYLPGMHADTFDNFILIIWIQTTTFLVATCFVYAFDTLVVVIFVNMLMVASLIVEEIRDLENALKQRESISVKSKLRMIKIIWMQWKYGE